MYKSYSIIATTASELPSVAIDGAYGFAQDTEEVYVYKSGSWQVLSADAAVIGCALHRNNSAFTLTGSPTVDNVTWTHEFFDTDDYHSTSSNTDRITIPSGLAGTYIVATWLSLGSGGGWHYFFISHYNSSGTLIRNEMYSENPRTNPGTEKSMCGIMTYANEGDFFRVRIRHSDIASHTINPRSFAAIYCGD